MPTATWKSRLRSGSAHWDLELAVEVRQCPLGSGAHGGGPAVPTGIWTARRRRRWRRRMRRRRRRRTALIKSNNPHPAGGEKLFCHENQWNWVVFILMNIFTGDLYSMYVVLQGIGSLPCIRVYIIYVIPCGEWQPWMSEVSKLRHFNKKTVPRNDQALFILH